MCIIFSHIFDSKSNVPWNPSDARKLAIKKAIRAFMIKVTSLVVALLGVLALGLGLGGKMGSDLANRITWVAGGSVLGAIVTSYLVYKGIHLFRHINCKKNRKHEIHASAPAQVEVAPVKASFERTEESIKREFTNSKQHHLEVIDELREILKNKTHSESLEIWFKEDDTVQNKLREVLFYTNRYAWAAESYLECEFKKNKIEPGTVEAHDWVIAEIRKAENCHEAVEAIVKYATVFKRACNGWMIQVIKNGTNEIIIDTDLKNPRFENSEIAKQARKELRARFCTKGYHEKWEREKYMDFRQYLHKFLRVNENSDDPFDYFPEFELES